MNIDWHAINKTLDAADREANPVGTVRLAAMTPRAAGLVSINGLPGTWEIHRSWDEAGVWMHEIERTR